MEKILFINGSMTINTPRGSISLLASEIFKKHYKTKNPNHEIINLDLNNLEMANKNMNANNLNTFFNDEDSIKYIEQLKHIDKIVFSCPMTNFNYPAVVKNYLDHILVAKQTFIYKYDGKGTSEGLLKHLKVQIITSQGAPLGWYPFGDHTRALKGTWEFMGASVTKPIIIDGTKSPSKLSLSKEEVIKDFEIILKKAAEEF